MDSIFKMLECHNDEDGNDCTKLSSYPLELSAKHISTLANYVLKTTNCKGMSLQPNKQLLI